LISGFTRSADVSIETTSTVRVFVNTHLVQHSDWLCLRVYEMDQETALKERG
jgi:hypothetical protein